MESNNPLNGCFVTIRNWDEITTQWSDDYFTLDLLNKKSDLSKEQYVKIKITDLVNTAFDRTLLQFNQLVSEVDKRNYIQGVFELADELIEESTQYLSEVTSGIHFVEEIAKLKWKLHQKFEDRLYALLHKEIEIEDKAKLKFNLSRTELVHLLVLLRDSNIIVSSTSNYALGLLSEKYFTYVKGVKRIPARLKSVEKFIHEIKKDNDYSSETLESVKKKIKDGRIIIKEDSA